MIVLENDETCHKYNENATSYLTNKPENIDNVYVVKGYEGLIHSWPFDGTLNDIVGGKNIQIEENGQFCPIHTHV